MLRVKNTGSSPAYDVTLKWDVDLIDNHGTKIGFCKTESFGGIAILLPGESIAQVIDVPHQFMSRLPPTEYTGTILFHDVSERLFQKPFRLSARQFMNTPLDQDEWSKTLYEMQKIPQELSKIRQLIKSAT